VLNNEIAALQKKVALEETKIQEHVQILKQKQIPSQKSQQKATAGVALGA
jgi:hypothetical protein